MQPHSVLEPWNIIIPFLSCVVWHMQGDTQVKSEHEKIQVISYSGSRSQRYAVEEAVEGEFSSWTCRVLSEEPYIARIQKDCTVQTSACKVR